MSGKGQQKASIAAIDDDPAMLRLVTLALEDEFEVRAFEDPRAALAEFEGGFVPDLVVSDVMMPYMIGFELHELTRRIPQMRSVPFVFLSAMSDRVQVRRGMSQGADDYITKPFKAGELRDAIRIRLARADDLREQLPQRLSVHTLGGAGMVFGEKRLQWEAGKVVVLIVYLLAHGRSAPLRDVAEALWSEPVNDNTLRVLLNRARRTLQGVGELKVSNQTVQLDMHQPVAWDAQLFEEGVQEALSHEGMNRIESGIKLYPGEFLPGFEGPWIEIHRSHLENLFLSLLEEAVARASGDAEEEAARARLEAWLDS